jgi:hypothetical protein
LPKSPFPLSVFCLHDLLGSVTHVLLKHWQRGEDEREGGAHDKHAREHGDNLKDKEEQVITSRLNDHVSSSLSLWQHKKSWDFPVCSTSASGSFRPSRCQRGGRIRRLAWSAEEGA